MDPKTLDALRASIAHWKENEQVTHLRDVNLGTDCCALCKLFFFNSKRSCEGCPVCEETGETGCKNSPYEDVCEAYDIYDLEAFHKAAKAEREFLESLLPPDTP